MGPFLYFGDETGNLDFDIAPGRGSRYFAVVTVELDDFAIGDALQTLRRRFLLEGETGLRSGFHATDDRQRIRDEVFRLLDRFDFVVDATILDKAKATPAFREDPTRLVSTAWHLHARWLFSRIEASGRGANLFAATLEQRRLANVIPVAVQDEARKRGVAASFAFVDASADPCLQVADYCAWALQRRWERNDDRSYRHIAEKVRAENYPFR